MSKRNPYVRPMDGWWLKNPFYIRYMIREATALFVGVYALVLLGGMVSLASGESAYNHWFAIMANPAVIAFHLVALAAAIFHTVTWFAVAPKVMPPLAIAGRKVSNLTIVIFQYVIAIGIYLALFCAVLGGCQ